MGFHDEIWNLKLFYCITLIKNGDRKWRYYGALLAWVNKNKNGKILKKLKKTNLYSGRLQVDDFE